MKLLHAHAQYIFIGYEKYQKASVKALVQVGFPVYALSKHKQNPCLKEKKKKKPEDHWSCIAHLSAEDMLKSAVIEEKKFKHSPREAADNPF